MEVKKRNGQRVPFKEEKIIQAIKNANNNIEEKDRLSDPEILFIANQIKANLLNENTIVSVEEIQDKVEEQLFKKASFKLSQAYSNYRFLKKQIRNPNNLETSILNLLEGTNEELTKENSNKDARIVSTQRDYMAGEVSKNLSRKYIFDEDIVKLHDNGIIHIHDLDYAANFMTNCCLVNLKNMFEEGTVMTGTRIFTPKSFSVACTIASQIIMSVAASQYGGQSISLSHLAPFIDVSRKKIRHQIIDECSKNKISMTVEQIDNIVESRLRKEITDGVQTLQHQIITMTSTNGQSPFITLFMYLGEVEDEQTKSDLAILIEEILKQRIKGIPNEQGIFVAPVFPKLVYALEEDNIHPDSKYYYLTKLAAECTAKRMVPDYLSEKKIKEIKKDSNGNGYCFPPMGCRSFLQPYINKNNEPIFYGRGNLGVVTLNLPHIALEANEDLDKFWDLLDFYSKKVFKAHMTRISRLENAPSDVAPILWQHGALTRLKPKEKLGKVLKNGYMTVSLGYAGVYETVQALIHKTHTSEEGKELAISILKKLNSYCDDWYKETGYFFSVYGTPLESTTEKFAKANRRDFGIIPEITEFNYVTNSYHINVREEIDAFSKLSLEGAFQEYSTGGSISYVEVPDMTDNIPAVLTVIEHIYNNIMYAELNTKCDYCMDCGYDGEIKLSKDSNEHFNWKCPNCGNEEIDRMYLVRRVCGYLGSVGKGVNDGRLGDYEGRVLHL